MVVQIISVVSAMLAIRWDAWVFALGSRTIIFSIDLVARMAVWFMVAVSVISAVDYFVGFWKKIDKRAERRRRRPFILSRRKKKPIQQAEADHPAKAH
jgi:CDP-diacylglycerol--glycerol-3-phosphate 3-phosphatidyltransferase